MVLRETAALHASGRQLFVASSPRPDHLGGHSNYSCGHVGDSSVATHFYVMCHYHAADLLDGSPEALVRLDKIFAATC